MQCLICHTYMHTYVSTYIRTYICIYVCIHICIYIYTYRQLLRALLELADLDVAGVAGFSLAHFAIWEGAEGKDRHEKPYPRGPCTLFLRSLVLKTAPPVEFGPRNRKCWVLGTCRFLRLRLQGLGARVASRGV